LKTPAQPNQRDVWFADLGEPISIEQGFRRPVIVVSVDQFQRINGGRACWCVPLTTTRRGWPTHIEVPLVGSGLVRTSFAKIEDLRSISALRLTHRLGTVNEPVLSQIQTVILRILGLSQ
jgi:mRNA interferase MazF